MVSLAETKGNIEAVLLWNASIKLFHSRHAPEHHKMMRMIMLMMRIKIMIMSKIDDDEKHSTNFVAQS